MTLPLNVLFGDVLAINLVESTFANNMFGRAINIYIPM